MNSWTQLLSDETKLWMAKTDPVIVSMAVQIGCSTMRLNCERLLLVQTPPAPSLPSLPSLPRESSGSSYDRGQTGEEFVTELLNKYLHMRIPCRINRVGKVAKSGDVLVEAMGMKVLIEVKNYKCTVGQDEVDKFIRDLRHTDVDAGVFISLTSQISNIPSNFMIKHENVNGVLKPTVYVTSSSEDLIMASVEMAISSADNARTVMRELYNRERVIERAKEVADSVGALSTMCADMNEGHDKINRILRREYDRMSDARAKITDSVKSLQYELYEEVIIAGGDTPESVYEKFASRYTIAEKTQSAVKEILEVFETNTPGTKSAWKLLKTKATHIESGYGFVFQKTKTDFVYSGVINSEIISDVCISAPNKYKITSTEISIEITNDTLEFVLKLVQKR